MIAQIMIGCASRYFQAKCLQRQVHFHDKKDGRSDNENNRGQKNSGLPDPKFEVQNVFQNGD